MSSIILSCSCRTSFAQCRSLIPGLPMFPGSGKVVVMRLFGRFKDLLRGPAQRHEPVSRIRIVPTADQVHTDMVRDLLTEQIEYGWDKSLPKPAPNPDDLYRPTLIGAWSQDRLVGGAFVMPDSQDAQCLAVRGAYDAAEAFERCCCMIQGIAVAPERRGEGIGTRIKRAVDAWAARHNACLIPGIPTNDEACRMNQKAGYVTLPPLVPLVVKITYHGRQTLCIFPIDDTVPGSRWAFRPVGQSADPALAIGQWNMEGTRRGDHDGRLPVQWIADTTAGIPNA